MCVFMKGLCPKQVLQLCQLLCMNSKKGKASSFVSHLSNTVYIELINNCVFVRYPWKMTLPIYLFLARWRVRLWHAQAKRPTERLNTRLAECQANRHDAGAQGALFLRAFHNPSPVMNFHLYNHLFNAEGWQSSTGKACAPRKWGKAWKMIHGSDSV